MGADKKAKHMDLIVGAGLSYIAGVSWGKEVERIGEQNGVEWQKTERGVVCREGGMSRDVEGDSRAWRVAAMSSCH